jgi:hypothetical protein
LRVSHNIRIMGRWGWLDGWFPNIIKALEKWERKIVRANESQNRMRATPKSKKEINPPPPRIELGYPGIAIAVQADFLDIEQ